MAKKVQSIPIGDHDCIYNLYSPHHSWMQIFEPKATGEPKAAKFAAKSFVYLIN